MELIATPGADDANSYVTLEDADEYFEASLDNALWLSYTPMERETGLIVATRDIEAIAFSGDKHDPVTPQALHFPRRLDGLVIIPEVATATCEQALWRLGKWRSPDMIDRRELQAQGVMSVSLDGVSESYDGGGGYNGLCPRAQQLLSALQRGNARIVPRYDRREYGWPCGE